MKVMRAAEVRRVLREYLSRDVEVIYRRHARRRMDERGVSEVDVLNVLRGGWCDESCTEVDAHGEVSYRVATNRHYVVVKLFTDPEGILVVTVVRFGRNR